MSRTSFWDTRHLNVPFTYKAGVGKVIAGWDRACLGMLSGIECVLLYRACPHACILLLI